MSKRQLIRVPAQRPIVLGHFTLTTTGLEVRGRPSFHEYEDVGNFIKRAHRASGFWLGDWLRYGESRADWQDRLDQAVDASGLSEKTLKNHRAIAGSIDVSRRRDDLDYSIHEAVAGLPGPDQEHWLEQAAANGWDRRELRLELKAARRPKILDGQAMLAGQYRVIYADPPWLYGDRPPSGSGAQQHYQGMTIAELCALPVAAHAWPNAVLFMWTTAPFLLLNPGPREVGEAWGFNYKTSKVWNKVRSGGGHYWAIEHEILTLWTRGSCMPDRPTPQPSSVTTIRREVGEEHSSKPAEFRREIERLYDGPYLELFARTKTPGWTAFGNDARLWAEAARSEDLATYLEKADK